MAKLKRTNSKNPDFINLVGDLDKYLSVTDGDEHSFYDQYNKLDNIKHAIVAYIDSTPVACGAIKQFDETRIEVKRMYTAPDARGKGVASQILKELEAWATELGYVSCILETGKRQQEAVKLYHKNKYHVINNYGPYVAMDNSVCFEKHLGT